MDLEAAHNNPRLCFWLKETITLRVANALQVVVKYRGIRESRRYLLNHRSQSPFPSRKGEKAYARKTLPPSLL